ncbi:MAG TPA: hypothetical protein VHL78_10875 [Actinomycetota bacterium]|nr:hypothetical protein [Actinomycetota bacterium]
MPANRTTTPQLTEIVDGLLAAPIGRGGRWEALRALRAAMYELREDGQEPVLRFVMALSGDGRLVSGRSPEVALFLLGYRVH